MVDDFKGGILLCGIFMVLLLLLVLWLWWLYDKIKWVVFCRVNLMKNRRVFCGDEIMGIEFVLILSICVSMVLFEFDIVEIIMFWLKVVGEDEYL